jgi:hypothetical protein
MLKGMRHQMNIFLKACKKNFKFSACFVQEKNEYNVSACFFNSTSYFKNCSGASKFCSGFPSLSLVHFLQCTFMAGFQELLAGFRNNFQDHERVSEQFFIVTDGREPEQAP